MVKVTCKVCGQHKGPDCACDEFYKRPRRTLHHDDTPNDHKRPWQRKRVEVEVQIKTHAGEPFPAEDVEKLRKEFEKNFHPTAKQFERIAKLLKTSSHRAVCNPGKSKHPNWAIDILNKAYEDDSSLTKACLNKLAKATGLTKNQVSNWFKNARKREQVTIQRRENAKKAENDAPNVADERHEDGDREVVQNLVKAPEVEQMEDLDDGTIDGQHRVHENHIEDSPAAPNVSEALQNDGSVLQEVQGPREASEDNEMNKVEDEDMVGEQTGGAEHGAEGSSNDFDAPEDVQMDYEEQANVAYDEPDFDSPNVSTAPRNEETDQGNVEEPVFVDVEAAPKATRCRAQKHELSFPAKALPLHFSPNSNFTFNAPFNREIIYELRISNPSDQHIVFAIDLKGECADRMRLEPSRGELQSGEEVMVKVILDPFEYERELALSNFILFSWFLKENEKEKFPGMSCKLLKLNYNV